MLFLSICNCLTTKHKSRSQLRKLSTRFLSLVFLLKFLIYFFPIAWQIKNNYEVDAAGCSECHEFWESIVKEGEP